jgi:hypothetical protein
LQVSLFIEFVNPVVEAVETKPLFLEGLQGLRRQALLMIEIFADLALKHMFVGAPSIAFSAYFYFLFGCSNCQLLSLRFFPEPGNKLMNLANELSGRQMFMMFLQHFDEGVKIGSECLGLGDGEGAYGGGGWFSCFGLFAHGIMN